MPRRRSPGFTLIEVVLAIGLAIGILVVALYFHHQSAQLRGLVIEEAEQISATRLLMERISLDLRTAHAQGQLPFLGSNSFLRFAKLNPPAVVRTVVGSNSVAAGAASDMSVVAYEVATALRGTNRVVTGVHRREQAFDVFGGSSVPPVLIPTNGTVVDVISETNTVSRPITERIRYLAFGFWDGVGWKDRWSASRLPQAVRVTLGWSSLAEGATEAEYGGELFRRVVVLPGYGATPEAGDSLLGPRLRGEGGPDDPDEGLYLSTP